MKSLISLLIRLPKTMPKYFAQQIYSRNSGMMQRMDLLSSIGHASIELSQISGIYAEKQTQLVSMQGDIIPLEMSTSFSDVCLYFFNPLMSEIHKWYVYLQFTIGRVTMELLFPTCLSLELYQLSVSFSNVHQHHPTFVS